MKVRVLLDEQGEVVAIERPQRGAPPKDPDAPEVDWVLGKGQKFYDLDVSDDLETTESAEDFYNKLKPQIARIKR